MKKRIVSLLMALVMTVSLLPVSAFAAEVDVPAAQDVPTVEQQNDEKTSARTFTFTSDCPEAKATLDVCVDGHWGSLYHVENNKTWELETTSSSGNYSLVNIQTADADKFSYDAENYNFLGWKLSAGGKEYTFTEANGKDIITAFQGIFSYDDLPDETTYDDCIDFLYINDGFLLFLWTSADVTLTACFESKASVVTYTPVVTSADTSKGVIAENGLNLVQSTGAGSVWAVTATPKNEWYKLDYVADEAGNKFVSEDGKTAQITVTAADQKFTAYFTSAIAPMYDETNADSVTVNVTISNDGIPLMGKDGTILANLDVTIPYFDLADYGLSKYYRYGTEFGWGSYNNDELIERPTALHAYIYLIERYYMGLPADQWAGAPRAFWTIRKKPMCCIWMADWPITATALQH